MKSRKSHGLRGKKKRREGCIFIPSWLCIISPRAVRPTGEKWNVTWFDVEPWADLGLTVYWLCDCWLNAKCENRGLSAEQASWRKVSISSHCIIWRGKQCWYQRAPEQHQGKKLLVSVNMCPQWVWKFMDVLILEQTLRLKCTLGPCIAEGCIFFLIRVAFKYTACPHS